MFEIIGSLTGGAGGERFTSRSKPRRLPVCGDLVRGSVDGLEDLEHYRSSKRSDLEIYPKVIIKKVNSLREAIGHSFLRSSLRCIN